MTADNDDSEVEVLSTNVLTPMVRLGVFFIAGFALVGPVAAQVAPRVHVLRATPETVAYGYYWSEATPVLRIGSGDIVDVETMLTSTPQRLEAAGVRPSDVQSSLRMIVDNVTDRGPGGHILTGPIYVEEADSGNVLEVRVLSVSLAIPYGYNGCSGFAPQHCG